MGSRAEQQAETCQLCGHRRESVVPRDCSQLLVCVTNNTLAIRRSSAVARCLTHSWCCMDVISRNSLLPGSIRMYFLELASYGVNDVDAARGSRCGFHGALFYTKAFLHAHGINWTAETKRKQEDDAAAADNDPMPLLAWKLKTSAPRPRRLLQRARHQHAVTTKARAPRINIIICIQHYI